MIPRNGGIFKGSGGFLRVRGGFLKFFFDLIKFRAFAFLGASIPLCFNRRQSFVAFLLIIFSLFYKYNNEKQPVFGVSKRPRQQGMQKSVHICSTICGKKPPLLFESLPLLKITTQRAADALDEKTKSAAL
ncbi:MAG: hypothetical protein IPH31_01205 [Lewinellaceae bacterium]|nr:hypothetical protein [Lewinellaceae bacterium]